MKHTPGPWYIKDRRYIDSLNRGTKYHAIGQVGSTGVRLSGQDEANAHLIKAAPDMYGALRVAERFLIGLRLSLDCETGDYSDGVLSIIRNAISEAEGRE